MQSNHLMYHREPFYPSEWWDQLSERTIYEYGEIFDQCPMAVLTKNGIIACHGLPLANLNEVHHTEIGSLDWFTIVWRRLTDQICTERYIQSVLKGNNANLIIRSHDHYGPLISHHDRVLTFTTSKNLPATKRIIVEVNLTKKIREGVEDVKVVDLDKEEITNE